MAEAVCIRCGTTKTTPWEKCSGCGFEPGDDECALLYSVYLSVNRFSDPEQRELYRRQLDDISRALKRGESIDYDSQDLARLREEKKLVDNIPAATIWFAVAEFFLPALVLMILGLLAFWLLSSLR